MGNRKRWTQVSFEHGIQVRRLGSQSHFSIFIEQELLDYRTYVFRGQANAEWLLSPSLDRHFGNKERGLVGRSQQEHLERFRFSARGRVKPLPSDDDENEWWALGRHSGLLTPLLDWTESPFIALYFAFLEDVDKDCEYRTVWALHRPSIQAQDEKLEYDYTVRKLEYEAAHPPLVLGGRGIPGLNTTPNQTSADRKSTARAIPPPPQKPETLSIVTPRANDNPRLISQRGLFTRGPVGVPVEQWVDDQFQDEVKGVNLLKIEIPNRAREACLKLLNRMNINHQTLFPDLYGSAKHCNMDLRIKNY